ncbi:MAG: ComF family protein [Terriglobales bacterium]
MVGSSETEPLPGFRPHCAPGSYLAILEKVFWWIPGISRRECRTRRAVFSSSNLSRATGQGSPGDARSGGRQRANSLFSAGLFHTAAQSLFATLLPSDCRLCQAPLTRISRLPVCDHCLSGIAPIGGRLCAVCGEHVFTPYGEALCGECRMAAPPFVRAVAYGSYDGGLRELIHLLKYGRVRPAAGVLGRMLAEVIQGFGSEFRAAVIVPVPLHRSKLRQRGFNQAEEIARAALKNLDRSGLTLAAGVLDRKRATESQTGLTDHQRQENVRGAFLVTSPELIKDQDVLLVDDVFTTGATASECARVLRRRGADRVFVATVARVLKSEATWATPEEIEEPRVLKAYA